MPSDCPLSVIIACLNEEVMIGECLASVKFAQEILVVDAFSKDRTLEIARNYTDRIFQHEFWSAGAQANWVLPQARNDWVLVVDADERITPELAAEIPALLRNPQYAGYRIYRRNFFLGKEIRHGTWGRNSALRLFDRRQGSYVEKHVHSEVKLKGPVGRCRNSLLHFSYRSLDDYTRKLHRFSSGGALTALEQGRRGSICNMLVHPLGRFLKSYVWKLGFLDGVEGGIIALLEADLAFLKYAKLWELERNRNRPQGVGTPIQAQSSLEK